MDCDGTYIGRKRTVLIEKTSCSHKVSNDNMVGRYGLPLFFSMDFLRKSRFIIEMKIDDKIINSDNIQGFSISHLEEKILKISTVIHLSEWVNDYEKVNIIKIYFLDGLGNEHRQFDFDAIYKGYIFDCNYKDDSPITPYFVFKIL